MIDLTYKVHLDLLNELTGSLVVQLPFNNIYGCTFDVMIQFPFFKTLHMYTIIC